MGSLLPPGGPVWWRRRPAPLGKTEGKPAAVQLTVMEIVQCAERVDRQHYALAMFHRTVLMQRCSSLKRRKRWNT